MGTTKEHQDPLHRDRPMKFARENRYIVIKRTDLEQSQVSMDESDILADIIEEVSNCRASNNKIPLEVVVVESDWRCYQTAWDLVKAEHVANQEERWGDQELLDCIGRQDDEIDRLQKQASVAQAVIEKRDDELQRMRIFYSGLVNDAPKEDISQRPTHCTQRFGRAANFRIEEGTFELCGGEVQEFSPGVFKCVKCGCAYGNVENRPEECVVLEPDVPKRTFNASSGSSNELALFERVERLEKILDHDFFHPERR